MSNYDFILGEIFPPPPIAVPFSDVHPAQNGALNGSHSRSATPDAHGVKGEEVGVSTEQDLVAA